MRFTVNTTTRLIEFEDDNGQTSHIDLFSDSGFKLIAELWLKVGWNQKYPYTFSWLGRPYIQIPEDMIRMQEVIYTLKPDVIVETGVAHGGSLVFSASICKALGRGKVIGIDIEIRPHNRSAIESHELATYIELIEGDSTSSNVVALLNKLIASNSTVLVILDSNHTRNHVRAELELYSKFVTVGSYIVATDGSMKDLSDVPRGTKSWELDNPVSAVGDFLQANDSFLLDEPPFNFNESTLDFRITHWPSAWLKRIK